MSEMTRNQEIAMTILEQMGGRGRLNVMVGAKNFMAIENGVQFKFGLNQKMNTCRVILNDLDLYDFELWQITPKRCVKRYEEHGLYDDMLVKEFETQTGLYLKF